MYPMAFKNVKEKLVCLDAIPIPIDTIDVIKSFLFHKINSRPYYEVIKKHKEALNQIIYRGKYDIDDSNDFVSHWSIFINEFTDNVQLQGIVCNNCGEFDHYYLRFLKRIKGPCLGFGHRESEPSLPKCTCRNYL